jgi:ribosomal protein L7/L12
LRAKQQIPAIKLVRQTTGMGLREAKEWVDAIAREA